MAGNSVYYGIDFGTTCCSAVSYTHSRNQVTGLQVTKNVYRDGGRPTPSIIAIDDATGEVFRGRAAREKRNELSDNCHVFTSVKSVIDEDREYYINDVRWTPVDIAAEIFLEIKEVVKNGQGNLEHATVAIPVGFDAVKRSNLRLAAEKAGITIDSFVSEPTAAFFANYDDLKGSENIVIFDWGGGTLDITVLQNRKGEIKEIAAQGRKIAGDNIDEKIARRVHASLAREKDVKIDFDDMPANAKDKLLIAAEKAKIELGENDSAKITILKYGDLGVCNVEIGYEWFADIIAQEVKMATDLLRNTIEVSELGMENIDRIVLVGGSSNLLPLLVALNEEYGDKLYCPENTEWNVGDGAARLNSNPGTYYANQDISLILSDGSQFNLLTNGTSIDNWKHSYTFGLTDTSREARFIFSGSHDIDESTGKYHSLVVPAYQFLYEKILVEAEVDNNYIFRVKAKSSMKPNSSTVIWEYPNLKYSYKLNQ